MHEGTTRRYWETIRRLRFEQARHQLGRRLTKFLPQPVASKVPQPLPLAVRWGPRVARVRPEIDPAVLDGRFRYWDQERHLELSRPWEDEDLGKSWTYPVHYFDYLPGLVDGGGVRTVDSAGERTSSQPTAIPSGRDRDASLFGFVESWLDAHPPGTGIAWEPYPTALRLVNWVDAIHALGNRAPSIWQQRCLHSIYLQAEWLTRRLERHLLGTHLWKDAKALLIAASVFDDERSRRWKHTAARLLQRELEAHVRQDGSHVEPSIMYHCTALEDLLDLLNFHHAVDAAFGAQIEAVAGRMLEFANSVQTPAGGFPLLGDAWEGGAPSPAELIAYAGRLGLPAPAAPGPGMCSLPQAAVVAWRDARLYVLADVGGVGPPHLSGHGHCDSLSFELWAHATPIVVDSGTWSYEAGDKRHACRSTRAHNTLEVDGREQHEIWSAFRVARRSAVELLAVTPSSVEAALVPWFDKRLRVCRVFTFEPGILRVDDRVEGPDTHRVVSRFHLHPACEMERSGDRLLVRHGHARVAISWPSTSAPHVELLVGASGNSSPTAEPVPSYHAAKAGELRPNAVLQLTFVGELPLVSCLSFTVLDRL